MNDARSNYKRQGARMGNTTWRLNKDGSIEDEVQQIRVNGKWKDFPHQSWWHVEPSERRIIWRKR